MKVKALIYCTKAKPQLVKHNNGYNLNNLPKCNWELKEYEEVELNGKIVCECEVDTEEIEQYIHYEPEVDIGVGVLPSFECNAYGTNTLGQFELSKHSCLTETQMYNYLKGNNGYALHLSNVKERVMELWETRCEAKPTPYDIENMYANNNWIREDNYNGDRNSVHIFFTKIVKKAPQNMMWVYVCENGRWVKYLLISIRPQWLCKILNGEKDIEVRRKILKGMCD